MTEVIATNQTILVVGGGISGLTAALEAAETGGKQPGRSIEQWSGGGLRHEKRRPRDLFRRYDLDIRPV